MEKKKGSGVLGGLTILFLGIWLLWYNEGRTVKATKGIIQAEKEYVQISSSEVKSENEGKLVALTGNIILPEEEVVDPIFNVSAKTAKLERKVEMYQWKENCRRDDDREVCSYKKEWDDSLEDSSTFKEAGHENPTELKYEGSIFTASPVKLDAFELSSNQVRSLTANEKVTTLTNNVEESTGLHIDNIYYTDVQNNTPEVGNIRISFYYNNYKTASVLAIQTGNSFTTYVSKTGYKINRIVEGTHNGKEILQNLSDSNKRLKWLLRAGGTLLVILALGSLIAPIQRLANYVPILGTVFGWITGIAAFLIGIAISLLVIAIAWFRYRPVMSICIIVGAIALYIASKYLSKNKKEEPKK